MTRDNLACPRVIGHNIKYFVFPFTPLVPARLRAKSAIYDFLVLVNVAARFSSASSKLAIEHTNKQ